MYIISEQVKELRNTSDNIRILKLDGYAKIISKAADTIESLSAKLQAANMEQLADYYEGERKLIDEMAEEIENCYGRETELSKRVREYLSKKELYRP